MPFFANTPESQMGRSDSKNPSTTCRGITSTGRPCRRPVNGANEGPAPPRPVSGKAGKLRVDDPRDEDLYCWQHKDQASMSTHSSPGPRMSHTPILEERTSIDTLADRLGIITRPTTQLQKPPKKPGKVETSSSPPPQYYSRPKPKQELKFCCCFRIPVEEVSPPPRPQPRPLQPTATSSPARPGGKKPSKQHLAPASSQPKPSLSGQSGGRASHHSSQMSNTSQTAQYMSLIPPSASPQTASSLLAELAKPISTQDEAGYIYMFWLTPETESAEQPAEAARSLLAPPSTPTRSRGQRRVSDVLASYAIDLDGPASRSMGGSKTSKKMLLKIGRATNVQRRLNEWKRQCGYNLSLIRYYPYVPSGSPATSVRKVPHSHKVERLIHLELSGLGLRVADKGKCDTCGREHREWFEVEATRKSITDLDEIIRRWADWDEAQGP